MDTRQIALTALAKAAIAIAEDRTTALAPLQEANAWLWRCNPDNELYEPMELEVLLHQSLETWLPANVLGDLCGVLISDGRATALCMSLAKAA
jgi:hypothetical protein